MLTPEKARKRAERGAAWLTELLDGPAWLGRVDQKTLNVASATDCPLAQALGMRYEKAVYATGLSYLRAILMGFNVYCFPAEPATPALQARLQIECNIQTEAWRELIKAHWTRQAWALTV